MIKLIIIGNLTRDPELSEYDGIPCCNFTVAVNKRVKAGAHPQAEYVRVTTWRGLADTCYNNLRKGRKVACVGICRPHGWIDQNGEARARIEMTADEVEYQDPKNKASQADADEDFTEVEDEENPF